MARAKTGVKPINKGNGTWLIRITCGYDGAGKKQMKNRTIHLDPKRSESVQRAEAVRQTIEWQTDYDRRIVSAEKEPTLKEYAEEWKDSYCRRKGLQETTIKNYTDLLNGRIIPKLGKLKLRDVTPRELNRFFAALKKDGLSGTYQKKYHALLRIIFKSAVQEGLLYANVINRVTPPKKDTKERPCYSTEQVALLVDALDKEPLKWRAMGLLLLNTGMRRGEAVGLNWADIDMQAETVAINKSAAYVHGKGQYIKEPKTKSGNRSIKVDRKTIEALQDWKREQNQERLRQGSRWIDEGAVFTQRNGKRMAVESPTQWFNKMLKKNGLPHLNAHGLRHTTATQMITNGADVVSVSKRLGHSRPSTTMDIYAHAYAEQDSALSDIMSAAMYGKKEQKQG